MPVGAGANANQSHAGWLAHLYQLILTNWRVSHFEAMYRCSLALAAAQHTAIREAAGSRIAGPTWAEEVAAAAQEAEAERLMARASHH